MRIKSFDKMPEAKQSMHLETAENYLEQMDFNKR